MPKSPDLTLPLAQPITLMRGPHYRLESLGSGSQFAKELRTGVEGYARHSRGDRRIDRPRKGPCHFDPLAGATADQVLQENSRAWPRCARK